MNLLFAFLLDKRWAYKKHDDSTKQKGRNSTGEGFNLTSPFFLWISAGENVLRTHTATYLENKRVEQNGSINLPVGLTTGFPQKTDWTTLKIDNQRTSPSPHCIHTGWVKGPEFVDRHLYMSNNNHFVPKNNLSHVENLNEIVKASSLPSTTNTWAHSCFPLTIIITMITK